LSWDEALLAVVAVFFCVGVEVTGLVVVSCFCGDCGVGVEVDAVAAVRAFVGVSVVVAVSVVVVVVGFVLEAELVGGDWVVAVRAVRFEMVVIVVSHCSLYFGYTLLKE